MSDKIKFEGNGTVWNYRSDSPLVEFQNGFAEVDAEVAAELDAKGYKRVGAAGEQSQAPAEADVLDVQHASAYDLGAVEFSEDLGQTSIDDSNDSDDKNDLTHNKRGRKHKDD